MKPSDEVADFELTMRVRKLQADFWCGHMRIEMAILEVAPKLRSLYELIEGIRFAWEIEQHDAWAIAQREPEAWLDRLTLGKRT